MRRFLTVLLIVLFPLCTWAGGPLLVDSQGVPQAWANGQITYYTDQGDLSPLLSSQQADQFVADAWSRWTSVPLSSLTVTHGGRLEEDVTGANFSSSADVASGSEKQLAVVYDADGSVVSSLLGEGAGAKEMCSTNAVIGHVDRIADNGHFAHAFVVINGNCAVKPGDLPVLKYQLVRAMGRAIGLGYSQLNDNVFTGVPVPTGDDYAGYPLMHPLGLLCNATTCMPNADVPRMDDRAALARLYPGATAAVNTARIQGVVRFPAWRGAAGQEMQGVNVVARRVDAISGRVSRQYAASSVSGFLFRGNAGNPITGYVTALDERWDEHGSAVSSLEGYYDLAGLEIAEGYTSATYEISVEPVNTMYNGSTAVGPYVAGQVTVGGSANPVRVTISKGAEIAQDFVMKGAAAEPMDRWEPSNFHFPSVIPMAGNWTASLSGYGDRDYYVFQAQSNRTFTFDVTAVGEKGIATSDKALPVLGVWSESSAEDSPEVAETYFNTSATATTRLRVEVGAAGRKIIGVADYRGDGRPDFRYIAHLFYADNLAPSRVGVQGGSVVTIEGFGFTSTTQVSVGGAPVQASLVAANQMVFRAPALADGKYTVLLRDPVTGVSSEMTDVLLAGGAGAKLILLNGANPQVPVGTVAPNAVSVRVVDGITAGPVAGATVLFAAPAGISLVGCSSTPCSTVTDQNGQASVRVRVTQPGASIISATLPTGSTVSATVNGIAAPMEITLDQPNVYVMHGANMSVPVSAMVVANGSPASGATVNFLMNYGTAVIAPSSSVTNSSGVATSVVSLAGLSSDVNMSACVAPQNNPCRTLMIRPVSVSDLHLQVISGSEQRITVAQSFSPIVLRVADGNGNPVGGVPIASEVQVKQASGAVIQVTRGEVVTSTRVEPAILSSSRATLISDRNGLVTLPIAAAPPQPVVVLVHASGTSFSLDLTLKSLDANLPTPAAPNLNESSTSNRVPIGMRRNALRRR